MYRNIMIPLDGSSPAEGALAVAIAISRRCAARLHLIGSWKPAASRAVELAAVPVAAGAGSMAGADENLYLEEVATRLRRQGVHAVVHMEEERWGPGSARRLRTDVDLVVAPMSPSGGFAGMWLGGLPTALIHWTRVPVLMVKPGLQFGHEEPEFRHVLAASDGGASGEAAVDEAAKLARLFAGRLTMLRVVVPPHGFASPYPPHAIAADREIMQRREEEAQQYLDRMATQLRSVVEVSTRVVRDYHAGRGILRAMNPDRPDLVVVGTRRRLGITRALFGSVADEVVLGASCPVLVAHDQT